MSVPRRPMLPVTEVDILLFGPRICLACGARLAACTDFFGRDATRPDGLRESCRACRSERQTSRYACDPQYRERVRTRRREWARARKAGA